MSNRRLWLHQTLRSATAGGAVFALAGCGFQLRRAPALSIQRITLAGFSAGSPMEIALRRALVGQVEIVTQAAAAQAVLVALTEARERSVLASTAGALVREIQLRLRFRFQIDRTPGQSGLQATEIMVSRDMSFNETQALAKAHEEAQIFREMEADVARQVLQRMAVLRP
jgi:LPS-assembly lipoprotein